MNVKLSLLEGAHEVAFVHRMIPLLGYEFITPDKEGIKIYENKIPDIFCDNKINLDKFYQSRLDKLKAYNKKGIYYDLAPFFYYNQQNSSLVICWNYTGNTKVKEINEILELLEITIFTESKFDINQISAFSIFIQTDADNNLEFSRNNFIEQFNHDDYLFRSDSFEPISEYNIHKNALILNPDKKDFYKYSQTIPVILYMLTTDKDTNAGNLDTLIQQLLKNKVHYNTIDNIINHPDYKAKETKKNKSLIGAIGQEHEPGSSNAVMIRNSDFITDAQIESTHFFKAVEYFLNQ